MVEKVCHGNFQLSGCDADKALERPKVAAKLLFCSCNQKEILMGCAVSSFQSDCHLAHIPNSSGLHLQLRLKMSLMCQFFIDLNGSAVCFIVLMYCKHISMNAWSLFITVECYRLLFNVWSMFDFITFKGCLCRCCCKMLTGLMRCFLQPWLQLKANHVLTLLSCV